jgi:glycosyltransferase involved in cell wall biosynthesis
LDLKIAVISTWKTRCGIATYSEALCHALAELGVEIYVVRFPRFGRKSSGTMRDIAERVPQDKISLIHIQHEYGLFQGFDIDLYRYLKALGKSLVTTMHAVGHIQFDPAISQLSSNVIVHNKYCARQFRFPSLIIPHGVNIVTCPPMEDCKKAWGIDPRMKIVGYCGFIAPNKGIELLLEAVAKVENVGLLIAGGWHTSGSDTEYINDLKQASFSLLPNRCQWIGYVPDDKLKIAYGAMDMVAYPSLVATESGALLTAIGHGKPVLATSIPPFREKEEVGALMTFTNLEDLTTKIKQILEDAELRQKLEAGARAYAESVSWPKIAQTHVELYESLITDKDE